MTPDQATTIILTALAGGEHPNASDLEPVARQLATALDAIGLLAFASDPQSSSIDPNADIQRASVEPQNQDWATTRTRAAEQSISQQFPNQTLQHIHNRAKGE